MTAAFSEATYIAITAVGTAALALATGAFVVAAFRQLTPLRATQGASDRAAQAAARAADAAEQSVAITREAHEQQSALNTYPLLACEATFEDDVSTLVIANTGSMPAHDVEAHVLQLLWDEQQSPSEYLLNHAQSPDEQEAPTPTHEGCFAVRDILRYFVLPARRAVAAPLQLPTVENQLMVLLQFRDVLGRNYAQIYQLGLNAPEERRYRLLDGSTSGLLSLERLELITPELQKPMTMPSTDTAFGSNLAEFIDINRASISTGLMASSTADWEDRGSWSDL
jgi:hypothetical protein